jgi:hypothetical protein
MVASRTSGKRAWALVTLDWKGMGAGAHQEGLM